ncbi:MAG: hypothetical protein IKZ46_13925 [Victivallales bacterium]|nr:hypothetical protein [Victivallales bacterium]
MDNNCTFYALTMDEYNGDASSLSCYNTTDYTPMSKCLGLISINNDYVSIDDVGFKTKNELTKAYPDITLSNKNQFSKRLTKSRGIKQFYVLYLDSDEHFENGGINVKSDGKDFMYCVLELYDNWAEVLDWGYSSLEQLLSSWNTEEFINVGKGKQWNN